MALTSFTKLFQASYGLPLLQTVRYRKPNIRNPRPPHWKRAVILKLTTPQYADPGKSLHPAETCEKRIKALQQESVQINPFEQILAREFLEKVEESKFIAIFHRNAMTVASLYANRLQLAKVGLYYHHHNKNIAKLAFSGTKYEALLQLYESQTTTFLGTEVKVARFLKIEKKIRGLVLMAAVAEGRLMNIKDLERYATLPSLPVLHSQLVGILSNPMQQLSQNLTHHQRELSASLSRYASDQSPAAKDKDSSDSSQEVNQP